MIGAGELVRLPRLAGPADGGNRPLLSNDGPAASRRRMNERSIDMANDMGRRR